MSYFVTGGTGFLGRFLIGNLLKRKGTVHVLVRKESQKKFDALAMQDPSARAKIGLAEALAGNKQYSDALSEAILARRTGVALEDDDLLWRALVSQARAERKLEKPAEALGTARAAVLAVRRLAAKALDRPGQAVPRERPGAAGPPGAEPQRHDGNADLGQPALEEVALEQADHRLLEAALQRHDLVDEAVLGSTRARQRVDDVHDPWPGRGLDRAHRRGGHHVLAQRHRCASRDGPRPSLAHVGRGVRAASRSAARAVVLARRPAMDRLRLRRRMAACRGSAHALRDPCGPDGTTRQGRAVG